MKHRLLYLAGPITGVSYKGTTDWRKYVSDQLTGTDDWKITAVSPMRGKSYLSEEDEIKASYEDIPLSCQKGITCRDRHGVMDCDAIFINLLGAKKVSVGTMIEIGWADILRRPIILVMEKEPSPFVVGDSVSTPCGSGIVCEPGNFLLLTQTMVAMGGDLQNKKTFLTSEITNESRENWPNIHDHPMVKECAGFIVDNLDDGIVVAKKLLMTGV